MKRSASEVIRNLEDRIAQLEKQSDDDTDFYLEAIGDILRAIDGLYGLKRDRALLKKINSRDLDKVLSIENDLKNIYEALEG